jgi:hypothetical protein
MQTDNTIQQTLLDVRKSYRFLYQYQKRILDLISFIGGKYNRQYSGGWPKFSNPAPRNGGGSLDCWAWDWLNMYFYEFNFRWEKQENDIIYFSVFLVNDTGYFHANNENNSIKGTNISKFTDVEKSESKLIFVVGKNLWDGWGYNWDEPGFILEKEGEKIKDNGIMIFKHYDLENFETEDKANDCLKDFESYCWGKGVEFKVIEKSLE